MNESRNRKNTNVRALTIALGITGTFLAVEVVAGVLTGSLALISDATHMMTDTIGLAIALAAIRIGQRPTDSRRTFGYQRFEILAAAFNAILLFGVAGYILFEGYRRLTEPTEIQSGAMLVVAALGLVVNLIAMRLLDDGKSTSLNLKGAYLEVWSDFLGSLGVIAASFVIMLTGWRWVDPVVAIAIGLWVLPRTWLLLKEVLNVLLEGVPEGLNLNDIAAALAAIPGVNSVHDLHVWALSSDSPSLSAHLVTGSHDQEAVRLAAGEAMLGRFAIRHLTLQTETTDCRKENDNGAVHSTGPLETPGGGAASGDRRLAPG